MISRNWVTVFLLILFLTACSSNSATLNSDRAAAARLRLGLSYLNQSYQHPEYLDQAYENLRIANGYSPNNIYVLFGLAQFYQRVGNLKEAHNLYRRLINEKQEQGVFLIYYGRFLCEHKQYKKAQQQFDRASHLGQYRWQVDAIEQSAYCALFESNLQKASVQFQKLFRLAPGKRAEAQYMLSYYEKRNRAKIAKNLSTILQQTRSEIKR